MAQDDASASENTSETLFSDVNYFLAQETSDQVKHILKDGGATREFYISDLVTHVIASNTDFSQHQETKEFSLPIVKPEWVLMCKKSKTLLPPAPFSPEENDDAKIFTGVTVCPSQLSPKDRDALLAMVTYFGGKLQLILTPSCTHLVVPSASGAKYEHASKHATSINIVTPSWVTDCIKNRKRLNETLYRPAKGAATLSCCSLAAAADDKSTAVAKATSGSESSDNESSSDVTGKIPSILSRPLSPNSITSTIAEVSSATVTEEVRSTKIAESPTNDGKRGMQNVKEDSSIPSIQGKVTEQCIGDKCETPTSEEKDEMFGDSEGQNCLEGCVFVIADYQDCMESSILDTWIEVIQQHGGVVSSFYSDHCTHLLCLHQQSDIFDKAIEDGKYIVTAHWLNDVLTDRCVFKPQNPLHLPVPFENKIAECKNFTVAVTGYEGEERRLLKNMIAIIGAKYTGYMSRSNTHLICKRKYGTQLGEFNNTSFVVLGAQRVNASGTEGLKYKKAREWGIPCLNAKWLSDVMAGGKLVSVSHLKYTTFDDSTKLEISQDLVSDLMAPWKKFEDQLTVKVSSGKKRKIDEEEANNNVQVKKLRKLEKPSERSGKEIENSIKVMFTGMTGSAVAELTQVVKMFGGSVAESPKFCTHLVAPTIVRTVKFLSAISVCQYAVTPDWLKQSKIQEKLLVLLLRQEHLMGEKLVGCERIPIPVQTFDPDGFAIKDKGAEQSLGINLKQSLERASKQPLLQGMSFYLTPNIQPAPSAMRDIIECAGGQVLTGIPSPNTLKSMKDTKTSKGLPSLVVISCEEDLHHCPSFRKKGFDIHIAEVLLSGVLKQELELDSL